MVSQFNAEWNPGTAYDTTANSSIKTFTVPTKNYYQYIGVTVTYTTNATVGDRLLAVDAIDNQGNVIFRTFVGVDQPASVTYTYYLSPSNPYMTALNGTQLLSTLPLMILKRDQSLKVYDINAVAPSGTGENMIVQVNFLARSVAL